MRKRLPFVVIIVTVALDAMGIGLMLPVMPLLIQSLDGGLIGDAAWWGGWMTFCYALMQFLFSPTLGALSDAFGRRPVLLISLLGMAVHYFLMAVADALILLFVARIIGGVAGASMSTATAYLADISPKEKRAANFGLVGAAFGVGFVFGPLIGGQLGELGPRAPFIAAMVLSLINAGLAIMVLPESLPVGKRRSISLAALNPLKTLAPLRRLGEVRLILVVFLLYTISNTVYPVIWSFYATERFTWSPGMVGASLAAFGLASALVQGGLIRVVLPRLGERNTAVFSLCMAIISLVFLGFVETGYLIFVFMPMIALGIMVAPALQGMMSVRVSDSAQGVLQGAVASTQGIAMIVAPPVAGWIFATFTRPSAPVYAPGAPFLAAAVLALIGLVVLFRVPSRSRDTASAHRSV